MLLVVDEAQTALGRVGTMFAFEQHDVVPDFVALSKTLGGGLPLSATITTDAIEQDAFEKGFLHVTSHVSDPLPAAVGRAVVRTVLAEDLGARAITMGARLRAGLEELQRRHEPIGDVRGVGLMLGVDLVSDRETREPDAAFGIGGDRALPRAGPEREHRQVRGPGERAADRAAADDLGRGHRPRARDPRPGARRLPGVELDADATKPGSRACPTPPRRPPPSMRPSRSSARTRPGSSRSCSSTACGCCRAAGTAGPTVFEEAGFTALTPGWPDDPETVEEANAHPEVFAGKTVGQVADHYDEIIRTLDRKPAVIGHSFGGLLTQILAGRGLAKVSVAIDPAPFRGVLPLPISALKAGSPVLGNPANRNSAIPLTFDQFRYLRQRRQRGGGQGALRDLRGPGPRRPAVPGRGREPQPLDRGQGRHEEPRARPAADPHGEKDHTVPWAIANAAFKKQTQNEGVTEIVEIPDRGHALTIDSGWREVADKALEFVKRFA